MEFAARISRRSDGIDEISYQDEHEYASGVAAPLISTIRILYHWMGRARVQ